MTVPQADGTTKRQCRACRLASMSAYKRNKRRGDPAWRERMNKQQREYRARRREAARAA